LPFSIDIKSSPTLYYTSTQRSIFAELQLKIMRKLFVVGAAIFPLTTAAPSALSKRRADLETIAELNDLPNTIGITLSPGDKYLGLFWNGMGAYLSDTQPTPHMRHNPTIWKLHRVYRT
jgi:hypothetical protein